MSDTDKMSSNVIMADERMDSNNNPHHHEEAITIWCDGCYDITHFGHANNLRQAKVLGKRLLVGVHSDEEIEKNKGSRPVFTSEERYALVRGIKWVDEVIEDAPYCTTIATLDKYGCHYCAHGDDITTTSSGEDTYQMVKDANRYKEVERTQGVSTTDLVNRILKSGATGITSEKKKNAVISPYTGSTQFIATTRKLMQFASMKDPPLNARIVYVDGTFDLFHAGHLAFLGEAKKLGDFLIVGLYDDKTAAGTNHGGQAPIMNLQERVQNILGYRYVDEVVIGAPFCVSRELLEHLNISVVGHGIATPVLLDPESQEDPYKIAKSRGIYHEIDSGSSLTTHRVMERILANRATYEKRNADKERKELARIQAQQKMEEQIGMQMRAED